VRVKNDSSGIHSSGFPIPTFTTKTGSRMGGGAWREGEVQRNNTQTRPDVFVRNFPLQCGNRSQEYERGTHVFRGITCHAPGSGRQTPDIL